MGRKKLKLKRIESLKERSSKFSKRKKGLFKKAEEVALLCDSDIMLIVVSPTEKPTVFNTRSRSFHTILERFCMLSLQEREERRAYTIKTLKKLVNENNTEISTENDQFSPENNQLSPENDQFLSEMDQFSSKNQYLSESDEVIQDDNKVTKLRELKELYAEKMVILRNWESPNKVTDLQGLNIMEEYLVNSLNHIKKTIKIKIQEEQQNSYFI